MFWAVVAVVGLILTVLVLLHPEAPGDAFGGRSRGGMAILGAFVLPPALVVIGVVFQFVRVHRFRVRGGGVIGRTQLFIVPASLDVRDVFAAFTVGGRDLEHVRGAMTFLTANAIDARVQTGQKIVVLQASPADRVTFAGVLRMDERERGVLWIDQEPLTITGEHFFDPAVRTGGAAGDERVKREGLYARIGAREYIANRQGDAVHIFVRANGPAPGPGWKRRTIGPSWSRRVTPADEAALVRISYEGEFRGIAVHVYGVAGEKVLLQSHDKQEGLAVGMEWQWRENPILTVDRDDPELRFWQVRKDIPFEARDEAESD